MSQIVILGGGFGGITAALELRKALAREHKITIVDKNRDFLMGLRKLWIAAGLGTRAEGTRSRESLRAKGIEVLQATVKAIEGRRVATEAGQLPFDFLVIALGAEPRPDMVPGFSNAVHNLYDPSGAERLGEAVKSFESGRIVVGILGLPYKCPPAPYEAAMLLRQVFPDRDKVAIEVFSPQPTTLPVLGKAGCESLEELLVERGITFRPNVKVKRLDGKNAVLEEDTIKADLFIAVPPHRPPSVVGNWIHVDPATLRTQTPRVYAVGDVVDIKLENGMPLPKAGVLAEQQAKIAAGWIVHELAKGPKPPPFDGRGTCFVETGGGEAAQVVGHFLAPNGPRVELRPPTEKAYRDKHEFERSRLRDWFEMSHQGSTPA